MDNNTTDLQVAKDLINLTRVINESIKRGESIYEKIINLDETKTLIQKIQDARESLNRAEEALKANRKEVKELEASTAQNILDAQNFLDQIKPLKDLPLKFSELGLDQNLLIQIKNSLSDLKLLEQLISESKRELQDRNIHAENQLSKFQKSLKDAAFNNKTEAETFVSMLKIRGQEIQSDIQEELKRALFQIQNSDIQSRKQQEEFKESLKEIVFNSQIEAQTLTSLLDTKGREIQNDIQKELERALSQIQIKSHASSTQSSAVLFDINKNFQESLNLYKNIENQKIEFQSLISNYEQEVYARKKELVNFIEQQAIENKSSIKRSKKIFEEHEETVSKFSKVLDKAGGTNAVEDIIKQMQISKEQLDEAHDRLASVRSFEGYLQEFKFTKNRKFFRKMLWREFGFVGMIVYLLSLFSQRRK
jgi:ribose 1,5-bisphosphokinase PhnN